MVKPVFVERNAALSVDIRMHALSDPDSPVLGLSLKHALYSYVEIFRIGMTSEKKEKMCLICYHLFKKKGGTKHTYVFAYILLKHNKR